MLQFIEAEDFYDGNPNMQLHFNGFNLPILQEKPELRDFNVKTFYTFIKNHSTDTAYKPVNAFLATLSISHQKEIASAMVLINGLLKQNLETMQEIEMILSECEALIDKLDRTIDLCQQIEVHTFANIRNGNLPIADMSEAGNRPQDRVDMTFYQDEAEVITAITILCKLISPAIGEFIYRHAGMIASQYKESMACTLFTSLFVRRYKVIIRKITHYVSKLVNPKSRDDVTIHLRGFTPNLTARIITDTIFTKKFVSIDLNKPDGSVIKYIASCIKSYLESQNKNGTSAFNVKFFNDPKDSDMVSGNEETNNSRVELESTTSNKPAIVPPLSRFAVEWIIKKLTDPKLQHDPMSVDPQLYGTSMDYYQQYPVLVSPISLFVMSTYFGPDIGGGKSIYMIDGKVALNLAGLLQILMVKSKYHNIAHALTMSISTDERIGQVTDFTFTNAWKASSEYADCRKIVASGFGEVGWDTMLKDIVHFLTTKTFTYHTSPEVWDCIRRTSNFSRKTYPTLNDTVFQNNLNLMLELLEFIKELWISRSHKDEE